MNASEKEVAWEAVQLVDDAKRQVAKEAAMMVTDGQILGMGTGSTTHYFIQKLGERIQEEEINIMGIPTSYQSFFLARDCNIPITTLDEHLPDLAVDGADEVDPQLNLIKGGGAAHTLEKIVDSAADHFLVIVDESKIVKKLGDFPVPVEVIPSALKPVTEEVKIMGGVPSLRMAQMKDGPVVTDNNNFILDVQFSTIPNPEEMEKELNNIPGVVENGLFIDVAHEVLVGTSDGVKHMKK
ncbi:ribose-5-phosphate isomerase RpiA [Methanobacterium ferruginis]|uniref:ribose-5-phosphate isomerase RpiA n=1 Tax=Methanobacterium ferruginis TaxID=710191 RepID=UPI0025728060|nr:ribose-5-phosphate isomerase RpiA [Methanobacterium ferruginis]BDZ68895.1 ribose 5-phosphate isomerase A [Methanobacterium ferruginis]